MVEFLLHVNRLMQAVGELVCGARKHVFIIVTTRIYTMFHTSVCYGRWTNYS